MNQEKILNDKIMGDAKKDAYMQGIMEEDLNFKLIAHSTHAKDVLRI